MPDRPLDDREAQAAREVGHTQVGPALARALSAAFLLMIVSVAGLEVRRDSRRGSGSPWPELASAPAAALRAARASGPLAGNGRLLASMTAFEDALDERSVVAGGALPAFQSFLTRRLATGSDQVVVGRRGWLYYRPALDYLVGPGFLGPRVLERRRESGRSWRPAPRPDPLPALADFAAQLAERGIGLVVCPVPVKAGLHPEGLSRSAAANVPLENPSFERFMARLAEAGIAAYSPAPRLSETRREQPSPLFLRTDTHWTPRAMDSAAAGLAEFLSNHASLPLRHPEGLTRQAVRGGAQGDLRALLRLPASTPLYPAETVLTERVLGPDHAPWVPDPTADVLVLGDSFTNIYSQPELGWGVGAGFAEQLAYHLQRPVDKVAVNAGGPSAARERLASLIAAGDDRLAGKRLVVYEFSARELSSGDWKLVDLGPAPATAVGRARRPDEPLPARGLVVWESSRSGDWRIWGRRLEGSPPRQLSPDEPGFQHCCAHLSADGSRLVYLSRAVPRDDYPDVRIPGVLHLLRLEDGAVRRLAAGRSYGSGNRAAVWRGDDELIYIDAAGRTRLLDLASGISRRLTEEPRGERAFLIDPTLRRAVDGWPTFSSYDPSTRAVAAGRRRNGCEPYFTHDGRLGFWVAGAGGPIDWIDLATGETGEVIGREDTRIPGAERYAYFPMLSADRRLLVFGASRGDHDHFHSNYDLFAAPVDPASLELLGRPLRLTVHAACDRYPDVHVDALDAEAWSREAPPVPLAAAPKAPPPAAAGGPFEVDATLRSCSRIPSLREIAPYRSALVVCEWDVTRVFSGEAPSRRLRIAHWVLRGGRRQAIATATAGFAARLLVEPLFGTAQIEGYPVFDTLPPAPKLALHYCPRP